VGLFQSEIAFRPAAVICSQTTDLSEPLTLMRLRSILGSPVDCQAGLLADREAVGQQLCVGASVVMARKLTECASQFIVQWFGWHEVDDPKFARNDPMACTATGPSVHSAFPRQILLARGA
jgi:hypothetical protein